MTVIVGSSNKDGSGSASNLTPENGLELNMEYAIYENGWGGGVYYQHQYDNIHVSQEWDDWGYYSRAQFINTGEWNADGLKEIYIHDDGQSLMLEDENEEGDIYIGNFADVSLTLTEDFVYYWSSNIYVSGAKRGHIDVSELDYGVNLYIEPQSNGPSWSNLFTVTTSDDDDQVSFTSTDDHQGTNWTEFNVSLNDGDDTFIYRLEEASSQYQTRYVDGGEGFDQLVIYEDAENLEFANFESISGSRYYYDEYEYDYESNVTLTLNEEILIANNADTSLLEIQDLAVEFADDYDSIYTTERRGYEYEYEYYETEYYVIITYDDQTYGLVTNTLEGWELAA